MKAPNLARFEWLLHEFGTRGHQYPNGLTLVRQVHSCVVCDADEAGGGELREADAILCRTAGTVVGVKTADCVPILLADPVMRRVAAIHAGWRGSAGNITGLAVRNFIRDGLDPRGLVAAVGPAIGPCCYETGPEVAARFDPVFRSRIQESGAAHLDLAAVNEFQLRAEGVTNIWVAGTCTFCDPERFESFRRDGEKSGRMISYIGRQ